jgi:hypothetical protein
LERVLIDDIPSGNEFQVFLPDQGESLDIELIGLEVPSGTACFAAESTAALAGMTSSSILIERDPVAGEGEDAPQTYAWIQNEDGTRTLLNRQMILEGFGAWSGDPPDTRFAEWLQQAERVARESNVGLWEECGGIEDPLAAPPASPTAAPVEPTPTEAATEEPAEDATPEPAPTEVASPDATATILPEPDSTATLEPSGQYPPSVAELAAADAPDTCDRIGWGTPDEETLAEGPLDFYAACHDAGGVYLARCVGSTEGTGDVAPAEDRLWIVCVVVVANGGDDPLFVSPVDFVLVDGNDRRYELDPVAMRALPADRVLQSGEVAGGEQVSGTIAFDVPRNGTRPFRLEIVPLVESNADTTQPAVIIIDPNVTPPESE